MEELSRREREKLSRRIEILKAARAVFASKEYSAATVDDIAAAAELSKGTIYLYFRNKADLFLSTFEWGIEEISAITDEIFSLYSDDQITGIKEMIAHHIKMYSRNMDLFKLVSFGRSHIEFHSEINAEIRDENELKKRMMDAMFCGMKRVAEYIQKGIDSGVFKQVNALDAAFVILAVINGFAFRQMLFPEGGSIQDKTKFINTILLDGLKK